MMNKWPEEEREYVIKSLMDFAANLEDYSGVLVITKSREGKPSWEWAGPEGEFSSLDVVALTQLVARITMDDLCGKIMDKKEDGDAEGS